MRKVYLNDFPLYKNNESRIDWRNSVGKVAKFIYDDVSGEITILAHDNGILTVEYNKRISKIRRNSLKNCEISEVIGKRDSNYRFKIGEVINSVLILGYTKITYKNRDYGHKAYLCKCLNDGYEWSVVESTIIKGCTCPVCSVPCKVVVKGINDVATTHPYLLDYFYDINDAYTNSYGSTAKLKFICKDCGNVQCSSIHKLITRGFHCKKCGDGASFSEKIMFNVLKQLNVDFISEASSNTLGWSGRIRYDFYIPLLDSIIETHGVQHYEETKIGRKSLVEEQNNDKFKYVTAINNGVINYIVIDCRNSELEWIKNNIMRSELPNLLNFKEEDIDWEEALRYTLLNNCKAVCDLFNQDKTLKEISKITGLRIETVRGFVRKGKRFDWIIKK